MWSYLGLPENYKAIWTKIEKLKNIELNVLPVFDDRHTKLKIRPYNDKVCTNFRGLNTAEDDLECEFLLLFLLIIYFFSPLFHDSIWKQILLLSTFRQLWL